MDPPGKLLIYAATPLMCIKRPPSSLDTSMSLRAHKHEQQLQVHPICLGVVFVHEWPYTDPTLQEEALN